MSEEMKLIVALCSALGFKVERTIDRKERKETKDNAMKYNTGHVTERKLTYSGVMLDIDKDGMYTSYLTEPEVSYKLIKDGD